MMKRILLGLNWTLLILCAPCHALEQIGRLGVGTSNQFVNNLPAISMKVQRSKSFAIGGMFGFDSENDEYGAGLKLYRILFDEPNLNFYSSVLVAMISGYDGTNTNTGWQGDLTLGTEMHLQGIESVGLSFEFGASLHKLHEGTVVSTAGYHIVTAGIHFYL